MADSDNKRVMKNATALTVRMILGIFVGLYTGRVILQLLGVDDYGIYGVIGSVVGTAAFLNSTMAGATSRFIIFELGKENTDSVEKIFSTALIIHFSIAIFVAILAETVGLWFVNNKMNFPPDSMFAVNVLYQFTIISMIVSFTQVPYSACVIAHEKMVAFANLAFINDFLKLIIVQLLFVITHDRLIWLSGMLLGVTILSALIYRWYCKRNFGEARFRFSSIDRSIAKEMLKFSGFDLYGNMCVIANKQSMPIIQNVFFGVVVNAAASIATTISGILSGLSASISTAFTPQITKNYAVGNYSQMMLTMRRSNIFTIIAFWLLCIPFFIETKSVLFLWLGQVPEYSVEFFRLIVITALLTIINDVNIRAIHATGNIKNISYISGSVYILIPAISYLVLRFVWKNVEVVYLTNNALLVLIVSLSCIFVHKQIPQIRMREYLIPIIGELMGFTIITIFIGLLSHALFTSWLNGVDKILAAVIRFAVVFLLGCLTILPFAYTCVLSSSEREAIVVLAKSRIKKIFFRNNNPASFNR